MAWLAFAFPHEYYGRVVAISEIFSTLSGFSLVPLGRDVIENEKWFFYLILLFILLLGVGFMHLLTIYLTMKSSTLKRLDHARYIAVTKY